MIEEYWEYLDIYVESSYHQSDGCILVADYLLWRRQFMVAASVHPALGAVIRRRGDGSRKDVTDRRSASRFQPCHIRVKLLALCSVGE